VILNEVFSKNKVVNFSRPLFWSVLAYSSLLSASTSMKMITLSLLICSFPTFAGNSYPRSPNLSVTPGALCSTPSEYRYPEKIAYCEREVNMWNKELVFITYRKIGYSLSGERSQYKIDHFIPLCAGGSNDIENLWPQYYTISARTDDLETVGCRVLSKGKITQKELIDLITDVKLDLSKVPEAMKRLGRLNR
jgi:hypothetical protein